MVVDDDASARGILAAVLRKEGLRVAEAESGEAALALARRIRPDAITLDIMMPRMDGWSVLTALKSDPELADIPVIVVTITTDRGVALSLGAADFMTKPIERNRLVSVLNTLAARPRHHPADRGRPGKPRPDQAPAAAPGRRSGRDRQRPRGARLAVGTTPRRA